MIGEAALLAGTGVGLLILGLIIGMAVQRIAYKDARERTEGLTDWEGDQ